MRNLMDKINHFESLQQQTVANFNVIFPQCKLTGVDSDLEVEIGELADTDSTRFLNVGTLIVKHNFAKFEKQDEEASDDE